MRLSVIAIALVLPIVPAAPGSATGEALYPDMRTVVPQHLNLVNEHQTELLRFSNAIANTGDGPWRMRPRTEGDADVAIQEVLDNSGAVAIEHAGSTFTFHEAHNHWHIGDVALFEVRAGAPDGPLVGDASVKVTFCLIDWYKLEGNSKTKERTFFDCTRGYQGVSVGWADQYHQATPGQELEITGAPPGDYYLVSTANPAGVFLEKDLTNNAAWTKFRLSRDSKGNPKIAITGRSDCSGALCGDGAPNR